jgi:hypothetical protein
MCSEIIEIETNLGIHIKIYIYYSVLLKTKMYMTSNETSQKAHYNVV